MNKIKFFQLNKGQVPFLSLKRLSNSKKKRINRNTLAYLNMKMQAIFFDQIGVLQSIIGYGIPFRLQS